MSTDDSYDVLPWFPISPRSHRDPPRPAPPVHVEFGAESRRGAQRAVNEDHYLVLRTGRHQETLLTNVSAAAAPQRFEEFAYGMVVADGIGEGGDVASRLATTTLAALAVEFGKWNVRIDELTAEDVIDRAERFYKSVDATLVQGGRFGSRPLQTTLTAVYTAGSDLFFAHVGHSRAYLCRDGEMLQLTHDHTLSATRPRHSALVDVSATAQDKHHAVTDTIGRGTPGGPRIDIERCGLLDRDVVLLCTNGLSDVVDEGVLAAVLRLPDSPGEQCRTLVNLAVAAGGTDDVTAVVARYRIPALKSR